MKVTNLLPLAALGTAFIIPNQEMMSQVAIEEPKPDSEFVSVDKFPSVLPSAEGFEHNVIEKAGCAKHKFDEAMEHVSETVTNFGKSFEEAFDLESWLEYVEEKMEDFESPIHPHHGKPGKHGKSNKHGEHEVSEKHEKHGKHSKHREHDESDNHEKHGKHREHEDEEMHGKHQEHESDEHAKHEKHGKHPEHNESDKHDMHGEHQDEFDLHEKHGKHGKHREHEDSDMHDKHQKHESDKHEKHGKHEKHRDHEESDMHDKHDEHREHDKFNKHEKHGKHEKHRDHEESDVHNEHEEHSQDNESDKPKKHGKHQKFDKHDKPGKHGKHGKHEEHEEHDEHDEDSKHGKHEEHDRVGKHVKGKPGKGKKPHHPPPHGPPHHLPPHAPHHEINETVWEQISGSKYTTVFASLIGEFDDLVELLNGTDANYTIFAPTDKAFEKIPKDHPKPSKEDLKKFLTYHISSDFYPAGRVLASRTIPTLLNAPSLGDEAQRLSTQVGFKGLTVNFYSRIVAVDIFGTNGVIHGIDSILVPPPKVIDILKLLPGEFSTLDLGLFKTGIAQYMNETSLHVGGTVFAPSNGAFQRLGPKINAFLFSSYGEKYLKALLEYHLVPNFTLYSDAFYKGNESKAEVGEVDKVEDGHAHPHVPKGRFHVDLPTVLEGKSLAIDVVRFGRLIEIKINGYNRVAIADGIAKDGVIHVVSSVLIPPKKPGVISETAEDLSVEEFKERLDPYLSEDDKVEVEAKTENWSFDL